MLKTVISLPDGPELFLFLEKFNDGTSGLNPLDADRRVELKQKGEVGDGVELVERLEPFHILYSQGAEGNGREEVSIGDHDLAFLERGLDFRAQMLGAIRGKKELKGFWRGFPFVLEHLADHAADRVCGGRLLGRQSRMSLAFQSFGQKPHLGGGAGAVEPFKGDKHDDLNINPNVLNHGKPLAFNYQFSMLDFQSSIYFF